MKVTQGDMWRLQHMLHAIADVEKCVKRRADKDALIELALQKLIENIGEMARGVSQVMKETHPNIPWANIIGMRHKLVHEYYRIQQETLWDVAEHKIPALKDWIIVLPYYFNTGLCRNNMDKSTIKHIIIVILST